MYVSVVVCLCLYAYRFRDTFLVVKLGEYRIWILILIALLFSTVLHCVRRLERIWICSIQIPFWLIVSVVFPHNAKTTPGWFSSCNHLPVWEDRGSWQAWCPEIPLDQCPESTCIPCWGLSPCSAHTARRCSPLQSGTTTMGRAAAVDDHPVTNTMME